MWSLYLECTYCRSVVRPTQRQARWLPPYSCAARRRSLTRARMPLFAMGPLEIHRLYWWKAYNATHNATQTDETLQVSSIVACVLFQRNILQNSCESVAAQWDLPGKAESLQILIGAMNFALPRQTFRSAHHCDTQNQPRVGLCGYQAVLRRSIFAADGRRILEDLHALLPRKLCPVFFYWEKSHEKR